LAVIADFQGAELDDEAVLAEYKEIRDAVLADVGVKHSRLTLARRRRSVIQSFVEEIQGSGHDCHEQSDVCAIGKHLVRLELMAERHQRYVRRVGHTDL